MSNRRIEDLTFDTQKKYWQFDFEMKQARIDYIVTCTLRTQIEQNALYEQGRTKPGKIVTWTRNSNHIKGTAFDIAIMVNGKILWNPSLDADGDGIAEYTEAGIIGEKVGLTWGGRFIGKTDAPHFEFRG
jgi:peptidoglycan L-alanyl-D-glutamate endopeptidase CwlK